MLAAVAVPAMQRDSEEGMAAARASRSQSQHSPHHTRMRQMWWRVGSDRDRHMQLDNRAWSSHHRPSRDDSRTRRCVYSGRGRYTILGRLASPPCLRRIGQVWVRIRVRRCTCRSILLSKSSLLGAERKTTSIVCLPPCTTKRNTQEIGRRRRGDGAARCAGCAAADA